MDYKKALATVSEMEGGEDMVKAITGEVSRKNSEAQGLRDSLKNIESTVGALSEKMNVSSEDPSQLLSAVDQNNVTFKALKVQLDDVTSRLDATEKEKQDALKSAAESSFTSKIKDAVLGAGVHPDMAEAFTGMTKSRYQKTDDGKIVNKDGIDLKDDLKSYLKDKPGFLVNPVVPGASVPSPSLEQVSKSTEAKVTTVKDKADRLLSRLKNRE